MSMQNSFKNPTENFSKFSPYYMYPHHSQTIDMAATTILFTELPELQFHYDPVIDSLYITATCHFRVYFFFRCDFAVPLFSPLFDPAAPFLAIPLYMAHPVGPPTSPPQLVQSLSYDSDRSKIAEPLSSSSSALDDGYAPANPGMANRFLSQESIQRSHPASRLQCIVWPFFGTFVTLGYRHSLFFVFSGSDTR